MGPLGGPSFFINFLKNPQKAIDIVHSLCYNKDILRERRNPDGVATDNKRSGRNRSLELNCLHAD